MIKFTGDIDNSREFWNLQYVRENREEYLSTVMSLCDTQRYHKVLEYVKEGDTFLDYACGFGLGAKLIKEMYPNNEVWGVDQADDIINDLALECPDIKFEQFYVGDGSLPKEYFDVIYAGEVIEHLEDPALLFKDCWEALKVGGLLIISTPDGDARPYIASSDHVWLFEHDDMDKMYIDNGFSAPDYPYLEGKEGVLVMFSVGKKI